MKTILIKNVCLREGASLDARYDVLCRGRVIDSVSKAGEVTGTFDRVIEGGGRLLTGGFYNTHCHSAMTLFRGLGADLPLKRWLDEAILPAEEHLTAEKVYLAAKLAIAEMLRAGIVSFSDMYFFMDDVARAVAETGIKANLSRSVVTFDDGADFSSDARMQEAIRLFYDWNGYDDGRILVDMSLHAEYTNTPKGVAYLSEVAKRLGCGMQIHLSETKAEHEGCIERHGCTPTRFFLENGTFDVPVTAAHCVWLTDEDRAILCEQSATVAHNPVSNLKLGSGIMPLEKTLKSGVNVAIGTDGVASNNRLDVLRELQTTLLLQKGTSYDPAVIAAADMWRIGSENGARAQRRTDVGKVLPGYRADLLLWDLSGTHNIPVMDFDSALMYSANISDLQMTMVDGTILYENGELTTIDEEKLKFDFLRLDR